ncbi:hypothetical protein GCM10020000_21260 [Streptomyces olivoverticillatus]
MRAGRDLLTSRSFFRQGRQAQRVGKVGDRCPGRDAQQEAQLRLVDIADAREVALVQHGLADGAGRVGEQTADGFRGVPVGAQQVGPEVADDGGLVGGAQEVQRGQAVADGGVGGGGQEGPDLMLRAAALPLTGGVDPPGAVHPEVRVERQPALDAGQQVLAARHDLGDGAAAEIDGGELGHPQVTADERLSRERTVKVARGAPDGVSFGHEASIQPVRRARGRPTTPGRRR